MTLYIVIASLRGRCIYAEPTSAIIECAGVGYEVHCGARTRARLRRDEECFLWVSHIIRAEVSELYAFDDLDDKAMFELLSSVSGIGPKTALAALSLYSASELAGFIARGESKALQKIPKVGARTAGRLVVDLKGKVATVAPASAQAEEVASTSGHALNVADFAVAEKVSDALQGLGFTAKESEQAAQRVTTENPEASVDQALRLALSSMAT